MSNLVKLLLLLNVIFVKSQDYLNTPVFNYTFSEGQFQPPILEYFKKNHQKYQRDSPKAWTGSPVQDPILDGLLLGEDVKSGGFIGPRKKRSTISLSTSNERARQIIRDALNHMLNMPLWCWKIYVNCIKYSNHACCPKRSPRRSKREDVTVVYGVSQRRSDQTWKPYSPYYIGLPGFKKPLDPPIMVKRCLNTDLRGCLHNPNHHCCGKYVIDRFHPIGPYVQPTLSENWMSALFEFAGKDPVAFTIIKSFVITAIIGLVTWGWIALGLYLGFIPKDTTDKVLKRADADADLIENVIRLDKAGNWLEQLKEKILTDDEWRHVKKFACCISGDNHIFQCVHGVFKEKPGLMDQLQCVHKMMYDIQLNHNFNAKYHRNEIK